MKETMKEKYDVGVVVGRFQVAELTKAHREIIKTVRNNHKQYVIVVGVSPTLGTKKDPLTYAARLKMLQSEFPDAIITHLSDVNDDKVWSERLDSIIRAVCPLGSVCLYGGRDSFIASYTGKFSTFELTLIGEHQGTKIREDLGKEVCSSLDFRKGIIYSCQNRFPQCFPTVDIALINTHGSKVLLARRNDKSKYQFPGGFVDPTDTNLEQAAYRELHEEIECKTSILPTYICSGLVDDWRYPTKDARIMTSLFLLDSVDDESVEIKDEFIDLRWIDINIDNLELVADSHKFLFENLVKYVKR